MLRAQNFDLVHEQVVGRSVHLGVYDPPTKPYLNKSMLEKAQAIFDKAEILADDPDVLWRVRVARMSVTWSVLARTPVTCTINGPGRRKGPSDTI